MNMMVSLSQWLPFCLVFLLSTGVTGFTTPSSLLLSNQQRMNWNSNCVRSVVVVSVSIMASSSSTMEGTEEGWINLVPENSAAPVRKTILEAATATTTTPNKRPEKGSIVTIESSGRLCLDPHADNDGTNISIPSWNTQTVLDCWLTEQQGLYEILAGPFKEHSVTGATLLDEAIFTEVFVAETLGIDNKIQCKKTIMAAKRLRSTLENSDHDTIFDQSPSYEFVLGTGKTVRAMELLVSSMAVGETSRVVTRCDYAYGSDGFRTRKGDVLVPPFCGIAFEVTLLSVQ